MKKFLLFSFLLMSCSDVDNEKKRITIQDAVNQTGESFGAGGGNSSGSYSPCNGKTEVRQFKYNGELFLLEIPIECREDWQSPVDPEIMPQMQIETEQL